MTATLSVMGLYNYSPTLFNTMVVPSDYVDMQTAKESILFECAELEVVYPDPAFMQIAIGQWSARELPVWRRIAKAIASEYNPIENYNRTENWNQTDTGTSSGTGSNTNTHKVTGYNSGTLVNQNQDEDYASSTGSSSLQTYHTSNVHGNIGVTTSQEMLRQELEIAPDTDIYAYIVKSFKNRFCLMVY